MRQVNEFFSRKDLIPFEYQTRLITSLDFKNNNKVVWAVSPNGGKTDMAICYIERFLTENPNSKILVLTHNTNVLKDNFYERILSWNVSFTHQNVKPGVDIDNSQVIVGLPASLNRRHLPEFDLIIIDEAHEYYDNENPETTMVQKIINKTKVKNELLLTGTPSKFIRKGGFEIIPVTMNEIYKNGNCSDVIVEMSTSSYFITNKDYTYSGEVKDKFEFNENDTNVTLKDVCEKLYVRITSRLRNPELYSKKEVYKPITNPIDWTIFRKNLKKTLIACKNIKQANIVAEYFESKDICVALTDSESDPNGLKIDEFQNDDDCQVLIVVRRAVLGFNEGRIENVVDMTMTKNIDRMYQLFCRATRKFENVQKLFIKVIPSDRVEHHRIRLTGMLCMMHEEWFTKFNGKNFIDLEIPTKKSKSSNSSSLGGGHSTKKKAIEPYPVLGLPVMDLFNDVYSKRNDPLSINSWTKISDVLYSFGECKWNRTLDEAIEIAKKYKTERELELNERGLHIWCYRHNYEDIVFKDLIRKPKRNNYEIDEIIDECNQLIPNVKSRTEFQKKYRTLYSRVSYYKLQEIIFKNLPMKEIRGRKKEDVFEFCKDVKTRSELQTSKYIKEFSWLSKHNLLEEFYKKYNLKSLSKNDYSIEECNELKKNIKSIGEFQKKYKNHYQWLFKNNLINVVFDDSYRIRKKKVS